MRRQLRMKTGSDEAGVATKSMHGASAAANSGIRIDNSPAFEVGPLQILSAFDCHAQDPVMHSACRTYDLRYWEGQRECATARIERIYRTSLLLMIKILNFPKTGVELIP